MFKLVGRLATAHPWMICAAWLLAGGAISALAPRWDSKAQDDDIRFLPDRCPSVRGYHLLEKAFPKDISQSRAIFAVERADGDRVHWRKNDEPLNDHNGDGHG